MTYKVGGVEMEYPIMIGAGVAKNPEATWPWLKVAPVVSGSYTAGPRPGNTGPFLFHPEPESEFLRLGFGLNSFGMPNPSVYEIAAASNKQPASHNPLIVSVAAFSVAGYLSTYKTAAASSAAACEGNFGCPNTEDHCDIMSFDLPSLRTVFEGIRDSSIRLPFWPKFSPYSNPSELERVAMLVNEYPDVIKAVTTCNTFGFAYAGEGKISPNDGFAGMSGPALKPIALGQVKQFRKYLRPEIDVIGVGGITTGDDVVDFLQAGATAVQIVSMPFWSGNPGEFWKRLGLFDDDSRLEEYLTR